MTKSFKLDVRGLVSFLGLLKCKRGLKDMETGEILEVMLSDTDVVSDLRTIVARSMDEIVSEEKKEEGVCLKIRKGGESLLRG